MENWIEILKGETKSTSEEILIEIKKLTAQKKEKLSEFIRLSGDLKDARVQNLGGMKNQKEIQLLESKVSQLKNQVQDLAAAIDGLNIILTKSIAKEKAENIELIDKEILNLTSEEKKAEKRFIELFGEMLGVWDIIFYGKIDPTFNSINLPWMVKTKEDKNLYDKAYENGRQGRSSFSSLIAALKRKRDKIFEGTI